MDGILSTFIKPGTVTTQPALKPIQITLPQTTLLPIGKTPMTLPTVSVTDVNTFKPLPIVDISKNLDFAPIFKQKDKSLNRSLSDFLNTINAMDIEDLKGIEAIVEKRGKQGLPLEYSRADFIKDLSEKLKSLPEEEKTNIINKLGITITTTYNGIPTYDGLISLKKLDKSVKNEAEIYELCEKFLLHNKIITGDAQTDKLLNQIIQDIPEFINIIGRPQHDTHNYSLDGHTLKVLKEVVSNPDFEKLSDEDKNVAILLSLLHDIGKKSGVVDKGHESTSSLMATDILSKINLPESSKTRIIKLIKYHNWFEMIKTGRINCETASTIFDTPEDLLIAEIFAEADIKSVRKGFGQYFLNSIKTTIENIKAARKTSKPTLTVDEKMQIIWGKEKDVDMNNPVLRHNTSALFELLKKRPGASARLLSERKFDVSPENFEIQNFQKDTNRGLFNRMLEQHFPIEIIDLSGKAKRSITGVKSFWPELNLGEDKSYGEDLIRWYQNKQSQSGEVNNALRNSQPLSNDAQKVVDFFDTHKRPLGMNLGLIRGTKDFPGMELSKMQPGDEFTDLGYPSTTRDAESFLELIEEDLICDSTVFLIIKADSNQEVIVPADWTGQDNMGEIILPRGLKFRVLENKPLHDYGLGRFRQPIEGRRALLVEIIPDTPTLP